VTCDNVTEGLEIFNLALTTTSGSAGVTLGRDTCVGQIVDSTDKKLIRTDAKFLLMIRMFNVVVVNFNQLSYRVMEDGSVSVLILLSKLSSVESLVMISTADVTAVGM